MRRELQLSSNIVFGAVVDVVCKDVSDERVRSNTTTESESVRDRCGDGDDCNDMVIMFCKHFAAPTEQGEREFAGKRFFGKLNEYFVVVSPWTFQVSDFGRYVERCGGLLGQELTREGVWT